MFEEDPSNVRMALSRGYTQHSLVSIKATSVNVL
jgi:hypothetical protein